jgi:outer membrane protein assembly factor BamB
MQIAHAENWPQWRGPTGQGVSAEKNVPVKWDATSGVRWRVALPERGNSTPIVWDDRVFLTQAAGGGKSRGVWCLNRRDGSILWKSAVSVTENEPTHDGNPPCSSSPVTDGERVIAWMGSAGVVCYDFSGREVWRRELGPQRHIWGWASSPVLHGDVCLLNFGPGERQFFAALGKKSGAVHWQVEIAQPEKPGQWQGSWSTPLMVATSGTPLAILSIPNRLVAFDPATGKEIWSAGGLNPLVYTSPLHADGVILANGGYNGAVLAVRTGGSGDVTDSHRLWHQPKSPQRIGSGVIHDGHVYIVDDPGTAECIKLQTGEVVWKERLPAKGSATNWSSAVLADGNIYSLSQGGDVCVFKAATKFEIVAVNSLEEPANASVAISNGDVFVRTHRSLWCIGAKPPPPPPTSAPPAP